MRATIEVIATWRIANVQVKSQAEAEALAETMRRQVEKRAPPGAASIVAGVTEIDIR